MQSENVSYWASILVLIIILAAFFLIQNTYIVRQVDELNKKIDLQNTEGFKKQNEQKVFSNETNLETKPLDKTDGNE